MPTWFVLVTALCYAILAGLCLWLSRRLRHQEQRQLDQAEYAVKLLQHIRRLESQLGGQLNSQIEQTQVAARRSEQESQELRRVVKSLSERVLRLEQQDPSQFFAQAAHMASMGASPEDLTKTCGLTQAEAELMSRLQQARTAAAS